MEILEFERKVRIIEWLKEISTINEELAKCRETLSSLEERCNRYIHLNISSEDMKDLLHEMSEEGPKRIPRHMLWYEVEGLFKTSDDVNSQLNEYHQEKNGLIEITRKLEKRLRSLRYKVLRALREENNSQHQEIVFG